MSEKMIIEGNCKSKIAYTVSIIMCVISLIFAFWAFLNALIDLADYCMEGAIQYFFLGIPACIVFAIAKKIADLASKCRLYVTDKGVYCFLRRNRRVLIPVDSISAIGMGRFKGITVTSASGVIRLLFVQNREDVYGKIIELLILRQEKKES